MIHVLPEPHHTPVDNTYITVPATDLAAFKELIQRGANLWPDAPPAIKHFADIITNGEVLQDYERQAGAARPPLR